MLIPSLMIVLKIRLLRQYLQNCLESLKPRNRPPSWNLGPEKCFGASIPGRHLFFGVANQKSARQYWKKKKKISLATHEKVANFELRSCDELQKCQWSRFITQKNTTTTSLSTGKTFTYLVDYFSDQIQMFWLVKNVRGLQMWPWHRWNFSSFCNFLFQLKLSLLFVPWQINVNEPRTTIL